MPRVQLLVTCIIDALFPQVGEAVVAVLERYGVKVLFPTAQTCCGQPAFNAGFRAEARALALHTLTVFEADPAPIVVPSGSCAAMLRHEYPALLADDPTLHARAQAIAARTYEFSEYLWGKVNSEQLSVNSGPVSSSGSQPPAPSPRFTYHPSCHLTRTLGVHEAPVQLLQAAVGAAYTPLPNADECCGFGGLFAVKHADISSAILEHKLTNLQATGAQTLVGCDMSCLMHIQGALQRDGAAVQCRHLAEVLARTSNGLVSG